MRFITTKGFSNLFAVAAASLAATILGLAAYTVAFYNKSRDYRVEVSQQTETLLNETAEADTMRIHYFSNIMKYQPPLTMLDNYCLLAAGVLGTVLGIATLVSSYMRGHETASLYCPRRKCLPFELHRPWISMLIDCCLAATAILSISGAWLVPLRSVSTFYPNYLLPPYGANYTTDLRLKGFKWVYTFGRWNCVLWSGSHLQNGPAEDTLSTDRVYDMCELSKNMANVTWPFLFFALARLTLQIVMWRRQRKTRSQSQEVGDAELLKKAELDAESSEGRTSTGKEGGASVYEMPAYRTSTTEMDDAAFRELEGDGVRGELRGDEVAVEAADSGTSGSSGSGK